MSTHEQYSDISKKLKSGLLSSLLALLGIVSATALSGCLVTDIIEFEDARNEPVVLVESIPAVTILRSNEVKPFTIKVWDADDQEIPEDRIAARIIAYSDEHEMYSATTCTVNEYYLSEDEGYGFEYRFNCDLGWGAYNAIGALPVGVKATVTVRVSDRGFERSIDEEALKTRPGAHYVDVTWVIIKEPASANSMRAR